MILQSYILEPRLANCSVKRTADTGLFENYFFGDYLNYVSCIERHCRQVQGLKKIDT